MYNKFVYKKIVHKKIVGEKLCTRRCVPVFTGVESATNPWFFKGEENKTYLIPQGRNKTYFIAPEENKTYFKGHKT